MHFVVNNLSYSIFLVTCFSVLSTSSKLLCDSKTQDYNNTCPPWWVHEDGCYCKRFESHQQLQCVYDDKTIAVKVTIGECLTWDDIINKSVITDCPYFSIKIPNVCKKLQYPILTSASSSNLTSSVCSPFDRKGTHCGECKEGYGPAPFLNGANIPCAKCYNHDYTWLAYLLLQLFMIALLYFTFVLCEFRGTSSPLNVLAYFYQVLVNAVSSNGLLYGRIMCIMRSAFMQILLTLHASWNLDFFRYSLPPVCVSPSMTNAQVLLFEYVIAFFPVLLTFLSYLLIQLHDKDFQLIVFLWRPFHNLISRYKRDWNPKKSILNTFATFLLLSYSKLLFTSCNLLYGVPVVDNNEKTIEQAVLYYDTSLKYFGPKHFPYVCLSLGVIVTFVLLPPAILLLYPTKCFKRCLEKCKFRWWNSLNIIMDVFQGWYKDGTEGTFDYRALSALYMILRVGIASEFILVLMFNERKYNDFKWTLPAMVHVSLGCFFLVVKPYKRSWMNTVDGLVLILIGILSIMVMLHGYSLGLAFLMTLLPILVAVVYAISRFLKYTRLVYYFKRPFRALISYIKRLKGLRDHEHFDEDSFVDQRSIDSDQHPSSSPMQPSVLFAPNNRNVQEVNSFSHSTIDKYGAC